MTNRIAAELTCQQVVELVTDYLEGRLSPDQRARFEQHLVYCDPCVDYLQQVRDTVQLSREAASAGLTPHVEQALLSAFRGWKKG